MSEPLVGTIAQALAVTCWAIGLGVLQASRREEPVGHAVVRSLLAAIFGTATHAAVGFSLTYGFEAHAAAGAQAIVSPSLHAGAATAVAASGFLGRVRGWSQPLCWITAAIVYAVAASWARAGGWLDGMGFIDAFGGILIVGLGGAVAIGAGLPRRRTPTDSETPSLRGWAWAGVPLLAAIVIPPQFSDGGPWVTQGWLNGIATVATAVAASAAAGLAVRHSPHAGWCAAAVVVAWCVAAAGGDAVEPTTAAGLGFIAGVLAPLSYTSARMLGIADRAGVAGPAVDGATFAAIAVALAREDATWLAQLVGLSAILGVGAATGLAAAVVFGVRPASSPAMADRSDG